MDGNTQPSKKITIDYGTELAISRTRLAADRTLMSWIRTSISLISFGFTIIKFFEYLKFFGVNNNTQISTKGITHLGIALILLGLFSLLPAMIEYQKEIRMLREIDSSVKKSY